MGVFCKAKHRLTNFPRAEHKPLEIEIYILTEPKNSRQPPEKNLYSLTARCEVIFSKNSMGKGKRNYLMVLVSARRRMNRNNSPSFGNCPRSPAGRRDGMAS